MYVKMYRTDHYYIAIDDSGNIAPCTVIPDSPPSNWVNPTSFEHLLYHHLVYWASPQSQQHQSYRDALNAEGTIFVWEADFPKREPYLLG